MFGLARPSRNTPRPLTYGELWDPPYNTVDHLEIPVPGLSTTEAMHPDVLDMGSAWNGYRYWMAFTPYNGDEQTEVPCIAACNSLAGGGAWEVPTGYTNPIAADPMGVTHYADTDLCYDASTDRLYVFYVWTDESAAYEIWSRWTDGDGTWSAQTTVLSGALLTYSNPAIIKVGSNWRLYYTWGTSSIRYRESTSPDSGYGAETTCTHPIDLGPFTRQFQNLNVVKDTDGTICTVIGDAIGGGLGTGGTLRFGRSTDGGTTFTLGGAVIESNPTEGWDRSGIYRASVLTTADGVVVVDNGLIHVWYSAFDTTPTPDAWGTAYVQLPVEVLTPV